jgi:hypothetical protein
MSAPPDPQNARRAALAGAAQKSQRKIAPASLAEALAVSMRRGGLFAFHFPKPVVRRTNSDGNVLH